MESLLEPIDNDFPQVLCFVGSKPIYSYQELIELVESIHKQTKELEEMMKKKDAVIKAKWSDELGAFRIFKRGPLGIFWWPTEGWGFLPGGAALDYLEKEERRKVAHRTVMYSEQELVEMKDESDRKKAKKPKLPEPPTPGLISKP